MSKNKATTIHGEVEYETVNCSNCDTEIMADEAIGCNVGVSLKCRSLRGATLFSGVNRNLCEYCADEIFGSGHRRGPVKTGFDLFLWRVAQLDDLFFPVTMATIASFCAGMLGLIIGAGIYDLITFLLGLVL